MIKILFHQQTDSLRFEEQKSSLNHLTCHSAFINSSDVEAEANDRKASVDRTKEESVSIAPTRRRRAAAATSWRPDRVQTADYHHARHGSTPFPPSPLPPPEGYGYRYMLHLQSATHPSSIFCRLLQMVVKSAGEHAVVPAAYPAVHAHKCLAILLRGIESVFAGTRATGTKE